MPLTSSDSQVATCTPRAEFLRQHNHITNNFALLTLSNANALRLFSFSSALISALRRFFDHWSLILSFREDIVHNFCEFTLSGKPWNSPKSPATESLLVEILAILYQHNYAFQSTVDYGRDHDDRVALVFAKPTSPLPTSSRTESPAINSPANTSSLSVSERQKLSGKALFAVSFPSATMLRVVSPPLLSTPAILQAVRSSWPRGVVSEKKIGKNAFEFKLKGYKWFQEDTFATDSLQHILSLLSSLDAHSFTLLTSLSLGGRSRVKDLWIFTGPGSFPNDLEEISLPDSPDPSVMEDGRIRPSLERGHRQYATDPHPMHTSAPRTPYPRNMTESPLGLAGLNYERSASPNQFSIHRNSGILQKPAPRAQIPSSVHGSDIFRRDEGHRDSTMSNTPAIIYSTSPAGMHDSVAPTIFHTPMENRHSAQFEHNTDPKHDGGLQDDPVPSQVAQQSIPGVPPLLADIPAHDSSSSTSPGIVTPPTPTELLGSGVFRNSSVSTSTELSSEIPIKWTGPIQDKSPPSIIRQESLALAFPGAWQPTPIEEKAEIDTIVLEQQTTDDAVQDVSQRVTSPEFNQVDSAARKSEAGIIGVIEPVTQETKSVNAEPQNTVDPNKGWVLVNVEGQPSHTPNEEQSDNMTRLPEVESPVASADPATNEPDSIRVMSPAAKAIVIIEAVDAKKKNKSKEEGAATSGRIKRLLSLSKKEPVLEDRNASSNGGTKKKPMSQASMSINERVRRFRRSEARRNLGVRRSIDGN